MGGEALCYCMGQCGISPLPCSHRVVWQPILPCRHCSCLHTHHSSTPLKIFFSIEVESLWSQSTYSNVTTWCNECCVWGHIGGGLSSVDMPCKKILSPVSGTGEYLLWCWWKYVAKCRRTELDWDYLFFVCKKRFTVLTFVFLTFPFSLFIF